ncbi:MAG TPA: heavy metal translocating P-type ATPase [Verrucomicrobiae bacterium]|nr:heavy metal translocating P-type ATPase [Verrucomicrobiae bacterium]
MAEGILNDGYCIIHDLASAMSVDPALKAVWLDARNKRVSFAFGPGVDSTSSRERVETVIARHRPAHLPECAEGGWPIVCEVCDRGISQPMPPGIRLLNIPGAGVMLEKESCVTGPRFWRWHQIKWVKIRPRQVPAPSELKGEEVWKFALLAAGICGVATAMGFGMEKLGGAVLAPWSVAAYAVGYIAGAWFPAQDVWGLLKKRVLDVHFLMLAVAAGAAFIGHWWEGAVLLFLFSFSDALEDLALARTEREIHGLFKEAPKEATVVGADGAERRLPVDKLEAGMRVRVRPGEQFPVDAEVVKGSTAADESNLTGESVPVEKHVGDAVFSGTMNQWGSVDCAVKRAASESALAKIIRLIRDAQESKAPSQRFTDRFGTGYTYAILGATLVMFLVWWLGMGFPAFTPPEGGTSAFYRAMTLLVVASPCALVLSIPSAILAGIAAGARRGILFRGGAAIERLAEVRRVALDKTGTLTTGELHVIGVESLPPGRESDVLRVAGALAHHSTHPVSRAIVRGLAESGGELGDAVGFRDEPGLGVSGEVDGKSARLGRRAMFLGQDWVDGVAMAEAGVTETMVSCGELRGRILLRDEVRRASAPLLRRLERDGISVTMLTGDREEAARVVAEDLGLREVQTGLKPEDKVATIRKWQAAGEKVAMVGDGVNDAPSLAAADVAVGMGLRGSDAVLEQADVVLMQDRLENFNMAYHLSRRARAIIRQNLAISLAVIALLVVGALSGTLPLTLGVVGHEGSTVVVVLNSLRLLFFVERA